MSPRKTAWIWVMALTHQLQSFMTTPCFHFFTYHMQITSEMKTQLYLERQAITFGYCSPGPWNALSIGLILFVWEFSDSFTMWLTVRTLGHCHCLYLKWSPKVCVCVCVHTCVRVCAHAHMPAIGLTLLVWGRNSLGYGAFGEEVRSLVARAWSRYWALALPFSSLAGQSPWGEHFALPNSRCYYFLPSCRLRSNRTSCL